MSDPALRRLAQLLRRPPSSLAAFAKLQPEELAQLEQLVERTTARQREALQAELRRALPGPLSWLLRPRTLP